MAALLCATMAMTACMLPATAAMADEPLKIEFFQQKGEEGPQKGYKEIIDKFNKENSDIEIEMNTVPDAGTVLTSRISSGDIPVIFSDFATQTQFKQKVANGYVQDLSDQDFLKNVNESALEMTKQEDGGYYALPYSRNYIGVYYNKKTFKGRFFFARLMPHSGLLVCPGLPYVRSTSAAFGWLQAVAGIIYTTGSWF